MADETPDVSEKAEEISATHIEPLWPERAAAEVETATGKIVSLQMTFVTDIGDKIFLNIKDAELTIKWEGQ